MTVGRMLMVRVTLLATVVTWPTAAADMLQASGTTVEVGVGDNDFHPKRLTIRSGTIVRWSNRGRNVHDILPNTGRRFGIDELTPGQTYRYQFVKPGRYPYYCSFHGAPGAGQHATIRVVRAKGDGAKGGGR